MTAARTIALPTYDVTVAPGALERVAETASGSGAHRYAVITDDNVGPLYGARIRDALGTGPFSYKGQELKIRVRDENAFLVRPGDSNPEEI